MAIVNFTRGLLRRRGGMRYALYIFIQIYVYSARAANWQRVGIKVWPKNTQRLARAHAHIQGNYYIDNTYIHTYTYGYARGPLGGGGNPRWVNNGSSTNQSRVCSRDRKPTILPVPPKTSKRKKKAQPHVQGVGDALSPLRKVNVRWYKCLVKVNNDKKKSGQSISQSLSFQAAPKLTGGTITLESFCGCLRFSLLPFAVSSSWLDPWHNRQCDALKPKCFCHISFKIITFLPGIDSLRNHLSFDSINTCNKKKKKTAHTTEHAGILQQDVN